ncbi:MAG TPA: NapC/NirT family cytochrome c [Acidobacteriota bacterium]|jgi:hypothetical protein|nr:NapC/NirT family cytochrome c [Acidobacteriota bacterium]
MANQTRPLIFNFLSLLGIFLAVFGLLGAAILGAIAISTREPSPSLSIFAWIVSPAICYLGIVLLIIGLLRERRRRYKSAPDLLPRYFRIDLNQPATRKVFYGCVLLLLLLLIGTSVGSYHAYQFTESSAFCGSTCHSVMAPERVTHQISPHAEVKCGDCHVGKTPAQYVKAKLYGFKELYLLASHKYPRPIPTPIHVMQPLRENCTGCHWERKFWGKLHRDYSHYITANDNQHWIVKMNVRVGGMYRFGGEGEGIHWHMKISPKVSYIATDHRLQKIPWVRVVTEDGKETIYRSTDENLSDKELSRYPIREITCVDCHSRPAHQFKAPILAIDEAMARGHIDPALPGVKAKGVELLAAPGYTTQDQAVATIREKFLAYYRDQHPDTFKNQRKKLDHAADTLATLYRQNFFPEMKADWRSYPDNIGHFFSDGCFRCHDGLHLDAQGKAISNECTLCHEIVVQGPREAVETNAEGLQFRHPVDFGVPAREMGKCTQCHDGTVGG